MGNALLPKGRKPSAVVEGGFDGADWCARFTSDVIPQDLASLPSLIRSQISAGFLRRDEAHLRAVFDQHKNPTTNSILKENFIPALRAFNIAHLDEDDADLLFFTWDKNDDNQIDLDEFRRAVHKPTPLEQWAQTLPLAQLLADCIPRRQGVDPLQIVSNLKAAEVNIIGEEFRKGFNIILREHSKKLFEAFATQQRLSQHASSSMASKFEVCSMSCGRIEDFHKGLAGRVGAPHLDFMNVMEAEHCFKAGCNTPFTSGNYQIEFTPKQEWDITVNGDHSKADMRHGRKLRKVEDLMKTTVVTLAKLSRFEVIAVVLYTGPMYMVYNAILRQFPAEVYAPFAQGGNLYSTTIHALVSAVQKVARVMRLPSGLLLYRGLGGTVALPEHFFKGDDSGCRGFADWGFMSTTSSKHVALQYSGVREGKPLATVLEIRVGAVDRGACVRDLSQYPGEIEYLWVPCSFLEPVGVQYLEVTADGVVTVIPIRVNANLKTLTVDELVGQKRDMHLGAFRYMLDEVRRDLADVAERGGAQARLGRDASTNTSCSVADSKEENLTVERFLERILQQCQQVFDSHHAQPAEDYTRDEHFRGLVVEMLDCKKMALSKLCWWLEDETQYLRPNLDEPLRAAHRGRIGFLERTLPPAAAGTEERRRRAEQLARCKGLILESVHERNEIGEERIVSAAAEGASAKALALLVAAGADVASADPTGETAMFKAARFGHDDVIRALVELGGDPSAAEPKRGAQPIHRAAMNNQVSAIVALLESRAAVDAVTRDLRTPLHVAALLGHAEAVAVLVASGADVNIVDFDVSYSDLWGTVLHKAAWGGNAEVVRILVAARADINAVGGAEADTPLHRAAKFGELLSGCALVEARADVNAVDRLGRRPLDVAKDDRCRAALEEAIRQASQTSELA